MTARSKPVCFALAALITLAVFVALFSGQKPGFAADAPLRVKVVDIKGTEVRLPIPDGYEEMRREDHPKQYDWMVEVTEGVGCLPLAYLIHAEDKEALKMGRKVDLRYAIAFADQDFWDVTIVDDSMITFRKTLLEYIKILSRATNEEYRASNEVEYGYSVIYDGDKSLSAIHMTNENIRGKNYKFALSESYIVSNRKIFEVYIYRRIYDECDYAKLKKETVRYLEKIDQGRLDRP